MFRLLRWSVALLVVFLGVVLVTGWEAFGTAPEGERLARMHRSGQWDEDGFENPQPLWNDGWGTLWESLAGSDHGSPREPIETVAVDPSRLAEAPASGLRVTWLGHSSMLLELDGHRVLTDPVWGPRSSPLSWLGPRRWYPPPLALADLPPLDAIVISHDHYDHLDTPTIVALADRDTTFIAPLGVGAHLEGWGVPAERIVELDWWEEHALGELRVVMVPARHASGRILLDQNRTLWAGYAFLGPEHRALFTGDTGLFPAMAEVGERLGPFDLTMIEVGQYGQGWPDWHLGPEQAVRAHQMFRGGVMLPVHWGLFDLANHDWTEPIERVRVAAEAVGVQVASPRPGESFEPTVSVPRARWWPQLPWRSAQEYAIVATKMAAVSEQADEASEAAR